MPQSGHHHFKTITQRNARQSAADPEHFAIPMDGDPAAATRHINVWSMLRRSYRSALIFFLESVTSGAGGLRPGLPSLRVSKALCQCLPAVAWCGDGGVKDPSLRWNDGSGGAGGRWGGRE